MISVRGSSLPLSSWEIRKSLVQQSYHNLYKFALFYEITFGGRFVFASVVSISVTYATSIFCNITWQSLSLFLCFTCNQFYLFGIHLLTNIIALPLLLQYYHCQLFDNWFIWKNVTGCLVCKEKVAWKS